MPHFSPEFLQFFKDLAANNNRDWFTGNKKHYELVVKKPFEVFITDMINKIKKDDPKLQIEAKDAIFRIYRDVRFSKDKTPYKNSGFRHYFTRWAKRYANTGNVS